MPHVCPRGLGEKQEGSQVSVTLYDLGVEFARLETLLIEQAGEWTEETEAAFAALGEMEKDRVDAYQHVIANLSAYATACQDESKRLSEKAEAPLNGVKRLKSRMMEYMQARGVEELKGEKWRAVIQRNGGKPPLTVLMEPDQLPGEFQKFRIEADTEAMRKAALSTGDVVGPEGIIVARIEKPGTHLRFR